MKSLLKLYKDCHIEALTMLEIAKPPNIAGIYHIYRQSLHQTIASLKSVSAKSKAAEKLLSELTTTIDSFGRISKHLN